MILSSPGLLTIQSVPLRVWGAQDTPPTPGFPGIRGQVGCGNCKRAFCAGTWGVGVGGP